MKKVSKTISDVTVRSAESCDIELLLSLRYEMLRVVKNDEKLSFDMAFQKATEDYFLNGEHNTVLAFCGDTAVGCATMSYVNMMPTCDHPGGKRGHLMNVYVRQEFRRRGIAAEMVELLLRQVREMDITSVSLDATDDGRKLYEKLGFVPSDEYMEMNISY
ncbi:MAG: GNAT family N-acetyltransferase [Oscillospiraceae bacterium]